MTTTELLQRLECGRGGCACHSTARRGRGLSHCPAHDDVTPSLNISEEAGKALWRCHAGCSQGAVTAAIAELDGRQPAYTPGAPGQRTRGRKVALYDYVDEENRLVYQVVRWEPKRFTQRRPLDDGTWSDRVKGVRRVLYRLPELLEARPARRVLLVEGEKDVDQLRALGFLALTYAGGVNAPWEPAWTGLFAGRKVAIIPDADRPGLAKAKAIARQLLDVAEEVKVVELGDLQFRADHGDDVSDWIRAGHGEQDLKDLVAAAPLFDPEEPPDPRLPTQRPRSADDEEAPPADPDDEPATGAAPSRAGPQIYSAADLEDQDIPAPRSVVPGILQVGLNMLAGKGKLGKSWIALDVALAITSTGYAFGNVQVGAGRVLYLALEDNKRRMKERLTKLKRSGFPRSLMMAHTWPKLDEGGLESLDRWLSEHTDTTLVIVDVWKRIRHKRAKNANLYDEDYDHLVGLQGIAIKHDIAVLVVHHTRKAGAEDVFDEINGSGGVLAALDTCIILHRSRSEADGEIWVTGRDVEESHLALRFEEGRWVLLGPAGDVARSRERREVVDAVIAAGEPVTAAAVAEAIGKPRNNIKQLMWKMAHTGELRRLSNSKYLSLVTGNSENGANRDNRDNHRTGDSEEPRLSVIAGLPGAGAAAHEDSQLLCPACSNQASGGRPHYMPLMPLEEGGRVCRDCNHLWRLA